VTIPSDLLARFQAGFSTPFLTAYPDLVFPARRDSQFGASLRQWRTAESCELGLARADDQRLAAALAALYTQDIPRRDTGRWRSAAEAERNEPATSLTRADLGWRSLLFARASLPTLNRESMPSSLLEGQGIAVFRRDRGAGYAALDYGHHGGGHGHPDRLNVLLAHGSRHLLDDMGTGSYVDPSLHWYRSTLAHNAPLVNGHSQPRASGSLLAYDERPDLGWVCASAQVSEHPPVIARRALVAMSNVVIDELRWSGDTLGRMELPIHARVRVDGSAEWARATLDGGDGLEDGYSFVRDARHTSVEAREMVRLVDEGSNATIAWITSSEPADWFTAMAPGAPGRGEQPFLLVRVSATTCAIRSVWDPTFTLRDVVVNDSGLAFTRLDGTQTVYDWKGDGAYIDSHNGANTRDRIVLTGFREPEFTPLPEPPLAQTAQSPPHPLPFSRELGESHYRMSEHSWRDAGSPRAQVVISAGATELEILVRVHKHPLHIRAADAPDPGLDNEHPDINSDGVQLHLWCEGWREPAAWLAIPEPDFRHTRVREISGGAVAPAIQAGSREISGGYEIRFTLARTALSPTISLDVLVNETAAERERRRGQLVLSGARGDRVYLRGDRQPLEHFIRLRLPE